MNRRSFLKGVTAGVIALTVPHETMAKVAEVAMRDNYVIVKQEIMRQENRYGSYYRILVHREGEPNDLKYGALMIDEENISVEEAFVEWWPEFKKRLDFQYRKNAYQAGGRIGV